MQLKITYILTGEVTGTAGALVVSNTALDDQYVVNRGKLLC